MSGLDNFGGKESVSEEINTQKQISELNNELIKKNPEYIKFKEELEIADKIQIKLLQNVLGVPQDGDFGPRTYKSFTKTNFYRIGLTPLDLTEGTTISENNIEKYKKNLGKLLGEKTEGYGVIDLKIGDVIYVNPVNYYLSITGDYLDTNERGEKFGIILNFKK